MSSGIYCGSRTLPRSLGRNRKRRLLSGLLGLLAVLCASVSALAADALDNGVIRAEFDARGLTGLRHLASGQAVGFAQDDTALYLGDESVESDFLKPSLQSTTETKRVYTLQSGRWNAHIIYELQPGWHFISKQVEVTSSGDRPFRVRRFEMLRGRLAALPADDLRMRETSFLRYGDFAAGKGVGLFVTLQSPFGQWKRQGDRLSLAYSPDVVWQPRTNAYVTDRLCLGLYLPSGMSFPAFSVPEWKLVPPDAPPRTPRIDFAEVDAAAECARAFLTFHPRKSERVMIGWCVNDYQIDIAKPEGRTEYKRIIDQAAAVGARSLLFDPANSVEAPMDQNRDAWGWENLLWFTMGQKVRKGEWDPAKDPLPAPVQEMVDYGKSKDVRFLAYVYPSLPFMQKPEWTSWVPNGQPGGYLGADTGQRSFQDWLLGKLFDFHERTGAAGFSFDHWWIAYEETPSSKYAQWDGCRRILQELRRRVPDIVVDGRQQYHGFGTWTWLAGTYPHPLVSDEQPESFVSFPDLHWSRASGDRQRRAAWFYRQECFAPIEIVPGYMTHQTPRNDEKGVCRRERFRPADWDLLGWKYSVISSIATAPFHHVINFLPARDEREFKAFSATDQRWFREWFDWSDANIEVLRKVRPITGAPQLGKIDGTAAFKGDRGFVFLFNPNYRPLSLELPLDASIGLTQKGRFQLKQLYPDAEKGRLLNPPDKAFWEPGDKVSLAFPGADALVLEVTPAVPAKEPMLLGLRGDVSLSGDKLVLKEVIGEPGSTRQGAVVLPDTRPIRSLTVNGNATRFQQNGNRVTFDLRFKGARFAARQQIGAYDPSFAGGSLKESVTIPGRVFQQLQHRKQLWPVDYTAEERAAVWLNSDRLLLYVNVAELDDEKMTDPVLRIDGEPVPLKRAYSAIVRSNPRNTFTGWYADVTSLKADVEHAIQLELPKLNSGQFQGLFFDTVEAEFTTELAKVE